MNQDMLDLLAAFNEGEVKYLVVGAHSVSVNAEPSGTKPDLFKLDGDLKAAVKKSLSKKKPSTGWPKQK